MSAAPPKPQVGPEVEKIIRDFVTASKNHTARFHPRDQVQTMAMAATHILAQQLAFVTLMGGSEKKASLENQLLTLTELVKEYQKVVVFEMTQRKAAGDVENKSQ